MRQVLMVLSSIIILVMAATAYASDCGDVNGDTRVNVGDVVYLINYIFKSGPVPKCGTETGTVTDIDGNTYQTITIGTQVWMAENLKVTHYRNSIKSPYGDAIPIVTDGITWASLTTGAYCEYGNDGNNVATYGRLYNWYAVTNPDIAPTGWHVPSDAEWQTLIDYLGGDAVAGGKMKEIGPTHWFSPNSGATDEVGFSGLPAGFRDSSGNFNNMGYSAFFWSSTELSIDNAWYRSLSYGNSEVQRYDRNKTFGFSLRCVKD